MGNNFVCTKTQVNKLADYWWKQQKIKKHVYECNTSGMRIWLEPGEYYTLDVGAAGTEENINSTVECYSVSCERSNSDIGTTIIKFREIQALKKHL